MIVLFARYYSLMPDMIFMFARHYSLLPDIMIVLFARYYAASSSCQLGTQHRNLLLGLVLSSLSSTSVRHHYQDHHHHPHHPQVVLIIGWCAWDVAGRSWLKLKKYQHNALLYSERGDR